jgi:hypothetical protein
MLEKVNRATRNGHYLPLPQNGEASVNGAKKKHASIEQSATIHPKVVGPATALMVRLLTSSSGDSENDCRFILRRLIRTGYVSARIHLVFPDILFHCMDHQSNRGAEVSCYTPLEVIHDIIDHCADVSERIMIISLKFCMSQISDEDIMSYILKSKRKWAGSDEVAAYDRTKKIDVAGRQSSLRRIRLLAVADLLSKMIGYSSCNDGILRHAMASELSSRELCVLIRIFRDFRVSIGDSKTVVLQLTQSFIVWLSCSLDVARSTTDDTGKLLQQMSAWIQYELTPMPTMFVVSAMVQQRLSEDRSTTLDSSASAMVGLKNRTDRQSAAGYQIERVQF